MIKLNYDTIFGCVGWDFTKVCEQKVTTSEKTRIKNRKKRKKRL